MNKKIEDYLHLYIGGKCFLQEEREMDARLFNIDGFLVEHIIDKTYFDAKPILRPLSDMSDEEHKVAADTYFVNYPDPSKEDWEKDVIASAWRTKYLCAIGIDLFGLIESGLAIDATKQNPNP